MSKKNKTIIELKIGAIDTVLKAAKSCEDAYIEWARGHYTNTFFAGVFIRHIDTLKEMCDSLKSRAKKQGEVDERMIAKRLFRYFNALQVRTRPLVGKELKDGWEKLPKETQKGLTKVCRDMLKEIFS